MENIVKESVELINNVPSVIISSIDEDGYPNTKAMLPPRKKDGIKHIYFSTNTSSMRVEQYIKNPKACLYFYDNKLFKGVMLKGVMKVIHDDNIREMIWLDGDERYYPKGIHDPDYCVLMFTAEKGRYYHKFNSNDFIIK
ncbi:pyridoxamine 5'-phosphate oxidase family protein [Vallitalea okinawensis]|uniref:pyridoxamine 5'-phosphate oxidase family protein n=1 Tax=Vallitalea okinawensis TaxID=2078660 RepID=UPI000CFDC167|nr:pyridoxamine 5'-phosphate oxidase family protein [Vallitalea okinawensis]